MSSSRRETAIVRAILDFLALFPREVKAWRQNTGALRVDRRFIRFSTPGAADITGILRGGRRLEVEVKRRGRKQTLEQQEFQREIERLGGLYVLAHDIEDVRRALAGYIGGGVS